MKIELKEVPIREVVGGYKDDAEEGVTGYGGKLNIRPKYQREFVYKLQQAARVIETVRKGFPLNVMYWVKNTDGTFEVLDGQQRTISLCQYFKGDYSISEQYFHNLPKDQQEQILDYRLMVYFCEGSDSEKLDWFRTINIAGEKLTEQELRNAVYTGEWLTDAKKHFSKTNCPAWNLGSNYLEGSPIRQEYLETVLDWISRGQIKQYMANHQQDTHATELWTYFQNVMAWAKTLFPNYRKEMKKVAWGRLYNDYKDSKHAPKDLEAKVAKLMQDDDVSNKTGIYTYLLTGKESCLSVRTFSETMKREAFERQQGVCPRCSPPTSYKLAEMEADHITPWHAGGRTIADNCQMLCKKCNREKGGT